MEEFETNENVNSSKNKSIFKSITIASGLITILGFLTGIQSISYISGESLSSTTSTGLSFSILFFVTLITFGVFYIVQMQIANFLYKKRILTIGDLFHVPADTFYVIFFGLLGTGFCVILIDANWGLDWTVWSNKDIIFTSIYSLIIIPVSFYMSYSTKSSCGQEWNRK